SCCPPRSILPPGLATEPTKLVLPPPNVMLETELVITPPAGMLRTPLLPKSVTVAVPPIVIVPVLWFSPPFQVLFEPGAVVSGPPFVKGVNEAAPITDRLELLNVVDP